MESKLKVLSYNLYGERSCSIGIPDWDYRQHMLDTTLRSILCEHWTGINVALFQEVNESNIKRLDGILQDSGFLVVGRFPMVSANGGLQFNVTAVHEELANCAEYTTCIRHDKNSLSGSLDCELSEERTTVFTHLRKDGQLYLLGNIHADHLSIQGKIGGICKSLNYITSHMEDDNTVGVLIGDMNMVAHMAEAQAVLRVNPSFTTLSIDNTRADLPRPNSYHGYGLREEVNVDFAFIPKDKADLFKYQILSKKIREDEGSDHRPVVVTIY